MIAVVPMSLCVQAANYMDIKPLLDLTCAKVASMIKGTHRHARTLTRSAVLRTRQLTDRSLCPPSSTRTGKTPEQIRKTFNITNGNADCLIVLCERCECCECRLFD
jgi:hypothetical protein